MSLHRCVCETVRASAGTDLTGHLCRASDEGRRQLQAYGHTEAGQGTLSVDAESPSARKAAAEAAEGMSGQRPVFWEEPAVLLGCPHAGEGTGRREPPSFHTPAESLTLPEPQMQSGPAANTSTLSESVFVGTGGHAAFEGHHLLQSRAVTADDHMLLKGQHKTSLWQSASSAPAGTGSGRSPHTLTTQTALYQTVQCTRCAQSVCNTVKSVASVATSI